MIEATRTRFLTAGGSLLAATGLAAAMVAGPALAEDSDNTTATAEVQETISINAANAGVTLTEAPGGTATDIEQSLTVESNSQNGYDVAVQGQVDVFSGAAAGNEDTFGVGALTVDGVSVPDTASPAASFHTTAEKSADGGDTISLPYELTMPWVNADTYNAGLTYTATSNG